ncbi:MAG: putative DNA-binding transcriptional regulator [Candidatus Omnitrophica bacterium ADurb.Bin292]|nr:MAG: putative DNA-binding transcriptional regulator [Candidatus Omnitrophica bacterium ADurb.Bin292]
MQNTMVKNPKKRFATSAKIKKRSREKSSQRILQAALEIFSEVGYDAATTKMISKRAGLNESLIQRYFTSKSNLLVEVTYSCIDALSNEKPYPFADTPQEEIYRFLVNKLESFNKNIRFFRVILSRILLDSRTGLELQKRKPSDLFFAERLTLFQKKGLIRSDLNIDELVPLITHQAFAITIVELILSHKSLEYCKKQLLAFSKNLTRGIAIPPRKHP